MPDWLRQLISPAHDVEDARRALLALAEEMSGCGAWAWDLGSGRITWSENMFRIVGEDPDTYVPQLDRTLARLPPPDRARMQEAIDVARAGQQVELHYRLRRSDGSLRYVRARTRGLGDRTSPVLVGWLQDLTETHGHQQDLAAMVAVTGALEQWQDFDESLSLLLEGLATALELTHAALWVPDNDALRVRSSWTLEGASSLGGSLITLRLAPGAGVAGRVWQSGEPLVADMRRGEADPAVLRFASVGGWRAVLGVPILHQQEVIAVISMGGPNEFEVTDALRATLTGIGHQLGGFLAARRRELGGSSMVTPREIEVLQLAAAGLTGSQIAERLSLSPATVKTHLANVYLKYGVPDRAAAVAKALREGLIH